jgi:hypothetical protein
MRGRASLRGRRLRSEASIGDAIPKIVRERDVYTIDVGSDEPRES